MADDERDAKERLLDELYSRLDAGLDKRDAYHLVNFLEAFIDGRISKALEAVGSGVMKSSPNGAEQPEPEYLYAYVKSGRKAFPYHLVEVFKDWEEVEHQRGDYVEHATFRKPMKGATADDRQIARDYATPFDSDPE